MRAVGSRLMLMLLCTSFLTGITGCFLNVFQAADTVDPGAFVFWSGLGTLLSSSLDFQGLAPQLHVRYGLTPRLDIGLGSGFSLDKDFQAQFLGVMGDLRYQLNASPAISIGMMSGNFPWGDVLSGGAVYISQGFGSLTPYGVYRFWFLLEGGDLGFSHQLTIGVEIFNRPRMPAIFEVTWRDGRFLLGFALRL